MNKNRAIKYLPMITALADGKTIQFRNMNGVWTDTIDPSFNTCDYRIKPKPIEIWCMVNSDNHCMGNFNSEIKCHNQIDYINSESVGSFDGYKPVMFRQVIDEPLSNNGGWTVLNDQSKR